ncbi:Uncharacterised protein [Klebsiella pneumoniae]|nr:Uncharacterised protein [Klebsiella pneumoniae]
MAEVHVHVRHFRHLEHFQHQADHLDIAGRARIAVQLGAQLDRTTRSGQRARLRMQHTAGIAQAARSLAAQAVRIHPRHLRRNVGTETHEPAGRRVGHLEGAQVKILSRAGEQRLQVFDMRGHDELVTPAVEQIQHLTAGCFDARRLRGQHLFDPIWQQPAVYRCHFASPLSAGRHIISESSKEAGCRAACCPAPRDAGDGRSAGRCP